jgi:mono/diheme cytochrome c family protein
LDIRTELEEIVMTTKPFIFLVSLVGAIAISSVAPAADAAAGRKVAEQNCAKCHNIEKGAPFKLIPPSFASIAVYRQPNYIWAKIVAPDFHGRMPEVMWILQPEDVENLVAYITSLEAK